MEKKLAEIKQGIIDGNAQSVKSNTEAALSIGVRPDAIIDKVLIPTMKEVGQNLCNGEIFIPDVLMSSRAMHASLYVLKPILTHYRKKKRGAIVIGTVAGDLHDIGKNMVAMILVGEGYEVIDLGIDVTAMEFVDAVLKYKADILALSALLTTTMGEMERVIEGLKEAGIRNRIKVFVGGGPLTANFASEIHADAYAPDLFGVSEAVEDLMFNRIGDFSIH